MSTPEYLKTLPINREGQLPPGIDLTVNGTVTSSSLVTSNLTVTNPPVISFTLDGLSDVAITAPATNQIVKYSGSQWVNADASNLLSLDNLSDVTITTPATSQLVKYNGTSWVNADPSTIPVTLDNLTDVTITTPATNQVVKYNGTGWVNADPSTLPISLDNLSDVTITTPSTGQLVKYNGSTWVNSKSALSEQTDVTITTPSTNQVLQYNGSTWLNVNPSTLIISLDNLSDVIITTPSTAQTVRYNGTNWVNSALASTDLSDYSTNKYTAYTPTISNVDATWSITSTDCKYERFGTSVRALCYILGTNTGSATSVTTRGFDMTIPVARTGGNFPDNNGVRGIANFGQLTNAFDWRAIGQVYSSTGTQLVSVRASVTTSTTTAIGFRCNVIFQYDP